MGKDWERPIEGMTERTERAFRQDAESAMGMDPVRAIVELVTNSDDAYVKLEEKRKAPVRKGSIRIEVERRRGPASVVRVKDRAGGMTQQEMLESLGKEASRTSGFEGGRDVRGLLGRGAKDCAAFGKIIWESVTPAEEARWELSPTGTFTTTRRKLRGQLARKPETVASLEVEPRFAIQSHSKLKDSLTRHYELRTCLADRQGREVRLVDVKQGRDDHLLFDPPRGELIADERISIDGYDGESAQISLYFSEENLDDGSEREYWTHGLLLKAGRASYDVFGGKFERESWSPYLGHFFGNAEVPGIKRLIKEYDDRLEQRREPLDVNPVRLVTRDRRGLAKGHPFSAAVTRSLEAFLEPHLEKFRKEKEATATKAGFTEDTMRRLRSLGKVIGRFFDEEEQALGEGDGEQQAQGLRVIPTAQVIAPGAVARFTVQLRPEPAMLTASAPIAEMAVMSGPAVVIPKKMELKERGNYYSRSFGASNLPEGEMCEIEVRVGDYVSTCLLECRPAESPDPVESLQFDHSTYRIRDGATRSLAILAPWELVADDGSSLHLSISGDPSIAIKTKELAFVYDYVRQCGLCRIAVNGRQVGSRAKITAALGEQMAVAELEVSLSGSGEVKFEFINEPLPQRALWEGNTLKLSALDKSFVRYLGPLPKFPGQGEVHFRTMLAEVVSFHAVRRVVEARHKGVKVDALSIYRDHMQLERKCLPRIHAALVKGPEIQAAPSNRAKE